MAEMQNCVKHKVPMVITSLRPPGPVVEAVHSYGGIVFHDVINVRHAKKAIDQGADGIITVCTGAGGHAGTTSAFALVKEVRETKADLLTTGHSAWSTDMKLWFVMIKDRKARFEDSDDWGDGWGWALFEAKDPSKNVSAGYDTSCLGCHVPAEARYWIYTYGSPALNQPTA